MFVTTLQKMGGVVHGRVIMHSIDSSFHYGQRSNFLLTLGIRQGLCFP